MELNIKNNAQINVDDYQFADPLKEEVLSLLKISSPIPREHSNVKAFHTSWDWFPTNVKIRNFKAYIQFEIEKNFGPGKMATGQRVTLKPINMWANVYEKGDYAQVHHHDSMWTRFSFAYFVKSKWYHPPLVFDDSGYKVRPKEGRFVAFPAYLEHHVPKNRFNEDRVTLSGNIVPNKDDLRVKKEGDS